MVKLLSYLGFWLGSGAFCSDGLLWQTGSLCPQETCLTSLPKRQPVGKMLLVSNGVLHTRQLQVSWLGFQGWHPAEVPLVSRCDTGIKSKAVEQTQA